MGRTPDPCGTVGAQRRHVRNHEPVDAACAQAWNNYKQEVKPVPVRVTVPHWDDAACANPRGMALFANLTPGVIPDAREICRSCPIQRRCLQWGVLYEDQGMWGGLTREEIRKERYRRGIRRQEPNSTWIVPRAAAAPAQKAGAA